MYRRRQNREDPWVSLRDHIAVQHGVNNMVLYGESSFTHHNHLLRAHGGMNVFIGKYSLYYEHKAS